jgi:hypothetical protein
MAYALWADNPSGAFVIECSPDVASKSPMATLTFDGVVIAATQIKSTRTKLPSDLSALPIGRTYALLSFL